MSDPHSTSSSEPVPDPRSRGGRRAVVLVAAGRSRRMGGGPRKPFLVVAGRTLLEHCAEVFCGTEGLAQIIVVASRDDLERIEALVAESPSFSVATRVVPGGEERADSVRCGVAACDEDIDCVAVHDAARPLLERHTAQGAFEVAEARGAALVAVPVRDTIKRSDDGGAHARETLDRSVLWAAQTPQVFRLPLLRSLLERAAADGFRPTDDAALHERYLGPIPIVEGSPTNLKITTPADLDLATSWMGARRDATSPRTGSST